MLLGLGWQVSCPVGLLAHNDAGLVQHFVYPVLPLIRRIAWIFLKDPGGNFVAKSYHKGGHNFVSSQLLRGDTSKFVSPPVYLCSFIEGLGVPGSKWIFAGHARALCLRSNVSDFVVQPNDASDAQRRKDEYDYSVGKPVYRATPEEHGGWHDNEQPRHHAGYRSAQSRVSHE